jgi:hypothetical protein
VISEFVRNARGTAPAIQGVPDLEAGWVAPHVREPGIPLSQKYDFRICLEVLHMERSQLAPERFVLGSVDTIPAQHTVQGDERVRP